MLPYAAYLRVYEPLAAFPAPERATWQVYAASGERSRGVGGLEVEHTRALWRLIAVPPIVVPAVESPDAYVRRADGVTYVCPWETRLRSWLAYERFRAEVPEAMTGLFLPLRVEEQVDRAFEEWKRADGSRRPHILSSTWQVPLAWFVPFVARERWLVLGGRGEAGSVGRYDADSAGRHDADSAGRYDADPAGHHDAGAPGRRDGGSARRWDGGPGGRGPGGATGPTGPTGQDEGGCGGQGESGPGGPMTAAPARTLIYVTRMSQARRRVARVLAVLRRHAGEWLELGDVEEVGRWLEEFHPHSLVELDYGGLVRILDDAALRADESVAEVAAAVGGIDGGDAELAVAMYRRVTSRWRVVRALESAN